MDDIVKAAMAKWPHVPDCRGWLALDARGNWYMRDAGTQAAGAFPAAKGSRIDHLQLRAFIARNYAADAQGQWYFQNGPQRVYVELEAAPWVWRVEADHALISHTGLAARYRSAWLDDSGRLFLDTDLGLGLVHSLDMGLAAEAVEAGDWVCGELPFAQMPARFGYCLSPDAEKPPAGGLA
ncbi:MAG: DUF2946 family protein [Proteobacteria bacterium]|nr:DUF2946 family protein [Pseudomonadota bacterium]